MKFLFFPAAVVGAILVTVVAFWALRFFEEMDPEVTRRVVRAFVVWIVGGLLLVVAVEAGFLLFLAHLFSRISGNG